MDKLARLKERRNPDSLASNLILESFSEKGEGEQAEYLLGAIQPVAERYTEISYEESARIENQLKKNLPPVYENTTFKNQGSVTNNTHIRGWSDIDLLVLTNDFYYLEPPQVPANPYRGDSTANILTLKGTSKTILKNNFPAATVADGAKCLSMSGGSLKREIDIVPGAWYNTVDWARSGAERDRGVGIINAETSTRIVNLPFMHNYLLDSKDAQLSGALKGAIRLLKNLKADSDAPIEISSYQICGICYHMPAEKRGYSQRHAQRIAQNLSLWLIELATNPETLGRLKSVNGREDLFPDAKNSVGGLARLWHQLHELLEGVSKELQFSHRDINEAVLTFA